VAHNVTILNISSLLLLFFFLGVSQKWSIIPWSNDGPIKRYWMSDNDRIHPFAS